MRSGFLALLAALTVATPAIATPQDDYLTGYVGWFDVTQTDDDAAEVGVEYRYKDVYYGLRPLVGAFVNFDGATYAYAGAQWDIYLSDRVTVSPNFAAGAYSHGSSKDLGYGIEFKSGIETAYEFDCGSRLGVAFNHMSNASLGDHNPGTENLIVTYSYPIGWAK